MKIGVVQETFPGEKRVAVVPAALPLLAKAGFEIIVQKGAGKNAGYPDSEYQSKGANLIDSRRDVIVSSDIMVYVRGYGANRNAGQEDLKLYKNGQTIIGFMEPLDSPQAAEELAATGVNSLALELMPRITRAQNMDALSSMATVAGYKAVLMAADHLPKMFPMLMTAAGTIAPAKVFVIGAGVAGLQAIATAHRLGAVVFAYDVRPAVKEQVESLGAKFVELDLETSTSEAKGGYAKAMDEEFYRQQRELMTRVLAESDVVISTAAVPGKKAPLLITKDMFKVMKPASVIIDLAAERGGNCELTQPDKTVVENDVLILGPLNLPSSIPYHSSQMYARNITNLLLHISKDGKVNINLDDEITRECLITGDGKVVNKQLLSLLGKTDIDKTERSA